jgi:hypothetical protein
MVPCCDATAIYFDVKFQGKVFTQFPVEHHGIMRN